MSGELVVDWPLKLKPSSACVAQKKVQKYAPEIFKESEVYLFRDFELISYTFQCFDISLTHFLAQL
jgi:hypothetical protein